MWEGLTGKRRKNGLYGMAIGIVVSAILLYLSFYITFLYLLIPVLLLVIFHYTKAWRFSDRAFYGLIAIVVAFFIAMVGISDSFTGAPHQTTASLTVSSATYDIHFGYYNDSGNYVFNFSLPSTNISNESRLKLVDLFTGATILSNNITLANSGTNYTYVWNTGQLSHHAYVVNMTLFMKNNSTKPYYIEFLGPVLLSSVSVILSLSESLILSYLLITFLFYLAFAFFARALSMSRKRKDKNAGQNPPPPTPVDQQVIDGNQQKTGWFRRRNY